MVSVSLWRFCIQRPPSMTSVRSNTVLSHISDMFTYPNFGVKKVWLSLKSENYHLPASVCVKKDLKKRSVRRIFCGNNNTWVIFVGVYFSKQYSCCRFAKRNGFQALQTFQNVIEYRFVTKITLESELLSLKWISQHQLPSDYHLCASVTYVWGVSNKQIWPKVSFI